MAELALENKFQHKTNKSSSSLGPDREGLIGYEPPWVMPDLVQLVPEHLLGWEGRNRRALSFGCDGSWSSLLMLVGKVSPAPGLPASSSLPQGGPEPSALAEAPVAPSALLDYGYQRETLLRLSLSGFQHRPLTARPVDARYWPAAEEMTLVVSMGKREV